MQSPSWLPSLVWTDYRLAVLFTVLFPLALLIWAFVQKSESIQHLLIIYWRVASLLVITVGLLIAAIPLGFLTGWSARILIPLSLWFWVDLNYEINEQPKSQLKLAFSSWRWGVTLYSILGAIAAIPALQCAFLPSKQMIDQPFCHIWLQPPWIFQQYFMGGMKPYTIGLLSTLALVIYILYLGYFVFVRFGKQGRSATGVWGIVINLACKPPWTNSWG